MAEHPVTFTAQIAPSDPQAVTLRDLCVVGGVA
jgi:hypothetical protein